MASSKPLLDRDDSEIIVGLVAPVGTEKSIILDQLKDSLKSFGYSTINIKISDFIQAVKDKHQLNLSDSPESRRINSYMDGGNTVREKMNRGDALALWAANEIALKRIENEGKVAFLLDSLKHPEEVITLRRIYGNGFFLIGIYSSRAKRFDFLHGKKGVSKSDSETIIERDYYEEGVKDFGQKTRETFHMADAFVSLANANEAKNQVVRILDLIFGNPFHTPSLDEFAMFHAFTARLRSADLSRQVGAVIVSEAGDLIGHGANDVPKSGGGLYWPGENDHRDYDWGYDSNAKRRDQILLDIVQLVKKNSDKEIAENDEEILEKVKTQLAKSILLDVTEFGRPVHAEMEAIMSTVRTGVSPRRGTLYCTTFPCHNCAKHIVAAGIKKVVYVEPYPKSKAGELHKDSIEIDEELSDEKVSFVPFVGVGSRRFIDLFSLGSDSGYEILRKNKKTNDIINWKRRTAKMRVPMLVTSYKQREVIAQKIIQDFYNEGEQNETENNNPADRKRKSKALGTDRKGSRKN